MGNGKGTGTGTLGGFRKKSILVDPSNQLFVLCRGAEISLFAIHPALQGRGCGQQLLATAEEEAFRNYDSVLLKVIPLFQEKLVAYYESLGYCSCDEHESLEEGKLDRIQERYHGEVDALILRKKNSA